MFKFVYWKSMITSYANRELVPDAFIMHYERLVNDLESELTGK